MKTLIVKDLYEANTIWGCVSYDDSVYSEKDIREEISEIILDLKAADEESNWQVNELAREFNKIHRFKDAIFATDITCMRI